MKHIFIFLSTVFIVTVLAASAHAAVYKTDQSLSVKDDINDDAFLSGNTVDIAAPISGDSFVAGNTVHITKPVGRSIYAAGNTVSLNDAAGHNVFAVGSTLSLTGTIDHDVYLAGQTVTLDPSTYIKGSLHVVGQDVKIAGKIDGDVIFGSSTLTSSATIGGSMHGQSQGLTFTGGAIGKDLTYKSNQDAQGLDKVTVSGKTDRSAYVVGRSNVGRSWLIAFLSLLVTGAALVLTVPRKVADVSDSVRRLWPSNLGWGLMVLIVTPILAGVLFATVVGAMLGVIVMALYIIGLMIAVVLANIVFGAVLFRLVQPQNINWWGALVLGTLVISLLRFIPTIGPIIYLIFFFGAVVPTLGAMVQWWRERMTASA